MIGRACLFPLVLAVAAAAGDSAPFPLTLEAVTERLASPTVLRGRYSQTKNIAVLSRPLESSGRFILSDQGLYWQQQKPFNQVLIADGERLAQQLADGPLTQIDGSQLPLVLSFSKTFLNLFRGKHADLETNFSIEFEARTDTWAIGLTPTSELLSAAIDMIRLEGRTHIDRITVIGNSSTDLEYRDEMTIVFSELATSPATLSEHESELYAW